MNKSKTYTSKVLEVCDNGDAIIELPQEMINDLGWQVGDTLSMELVDGNIVIKNLDNDNRNKRLDKPQN